MSSPSTYDPTEYPPFSVTADTAVFTVKDGDLHIILIERGNEPFKGALALPGGFVEPDEDLEAAALRELAEETGLELNPDQVEQLGAYGAPDRDPRMRVVTVVFWTLLGEVDGLIGGSDASDARLVAVEEALADPNYLAFDHHVVVGDAAARARAALGTAGDEAKRA